MIELHNGDCLEVMKGLADNSVDSIVTDPPYELGFMGKSWDNTGIANNVDMWRECLRVLKPGGYLLSFSATRTYHRMASAIEDAGFEIRDMIEWVYGSGFPKSHNIGKNIEKIKVGGIKYLKQIGTKKGIKVETGTQGFSYSKEYVAGKSMGGKQISGDIPVYEINNEWEGWGTALKPAHEPICMARKPLAEKNVAENCLKWGTGGINIDESRVSGEYKWRASESKVEGDIFKAGSFGEQSPLGRFPANLIHDGSDEVVACFPESNSGKGKASTYEKHGGQWGKGKQIRNEDYGDSGNASRFFKSIIYQPKASKSERNKGCEELEEKQGGGMKGTELQTLLTGSGNIRNNMMKNNHPTVKPEKLMEYLIEMVTPENGTVLEPFLGSGTTGVAAVNLKRNFIGIELDKDYFAICEKRINDAKQNLFAV